jgi:hypothetical protein
MLNDSQKNVSYLFLSDSPANFPGPTALDVGALYSRRENNSVTNDLSQQILYLQQAPAGFG